MRIILGIDHAAFELKEILKPYLVALGYEYEDMGAFTDDTAANDYHLTGAKVAATVVDGHADLGIVMCGTGIGMSIAANKVRGLLQHFATVFLVLRKQVSTIMPICWCWGRA